MIEITMKFYVLDGDTDVAEEVVDDVADLVGGAFENVITESDAEIRELTSEESAQVHAKQIY